jgi:hypothetical protein
VDEKEMQALTKDTEHAPAMEVHLGEVFTDPDLNAVSGRQRICIIWLNGKRWEGVLAETADTNG